MVSLPEVPVTLLEEIKAEKAMKEELKASTAKDNEFERDSDNYSADLNPLEDPGTTDTVIRDANNFVDDLFLKIENNYGNENVNEELSKEETLQKLKT